MVMVLNALGLPAPAVPEYEPYRTFTQDNVLSERTDAVLPRETLAHQGMTLDQLGGILATQPVKAEVHHAADSSVDEFRKLASAYLGEPGHFVIVNYLRKAIGEQTGGHISPLAAYDAKADRFLILDVARYKYPPVWVKTADMFAAMNTPDAVNDNKSRGFVLVDGVDCPIAPFGLRRSLGGPPFRCENDGKKRDALQSYREAHGAAGLRTGPPPALSARAKASQAASSSNSTRRRSPSPEGLLAARRLDLPPTRLRRVGQVVSDRPDARDRDDRRLRRAFFDPVIVRGLRHPAHE